MKNQSGFTLIEMLIVVIILGTLAMVIIPQVSVSTEDAKLNTLRTNLSTVRKAIELYYHQHGQTYPGAKKTDGSDNDTMAGEAKNVFVHQLTKFTEANGKADGDYTALTPPIYGPYLKSVKLPENPYNNKDTVTCDIVVTNVTVRVPTPADGTGWKYYVKTGVFTANDSVANTQY